MVNALSEREIKFTVSGPEVGYEGYSAAAYSDALTAFAKMQREGSVAGAARAFMMPPMRSWLRPVEPQPVWVKPTEDELRAHILESWPETDVDAHMAQRARLEAQRVARERWEASWRGRIASGYRKSSREILERVQGAWGVLRHGVDEGDEW